MTLTNKQEQGLKIAVERFNHHKPWACIAGYVVRVKCLDISGESMKNRFYI